MSQRDLPEGRFHVSPAIEKIGEAQGFSPRRRRVEELGEILVSEVGVDDEDLITERRGG